jgi:hypothetical protein
MKNFEAKNDKIVLFLGLILLLKDHRMVSKGNIRHSLPEIFFLTLAAVVSG